MEERQTYKRSWYDPIGWIVMVNIIKNDVTSLTTTCDS